MSPFKKCEASSAKGSKRCNLIKMQGSFNPGGEQRRGHERIGCYPHQIHPQRIQIYLSFFFFFFAAHTCCLRGLRMTTLNLPIGVDMTMKGEKGWPLIGI